MKPPSHSRRLITMIAAWWILSAASYGSLVFETQEIQQTASSGQKNASAVFRFKNSGANIIIIKSVQPSCGCTTAQLAKEIYAPGETGEIKVVFNFEGRVGQQDKIVQVMTDDESNKVIPLTLHVEIIEPLKCSTHLLPWRVDEEPGDKEMIIAPTPPRKITAISTQPASAGDIAARVEPIGSEGRFRLIVRPASPTKVINVGIACVAPFADGTTHPFTVFALVR